METSSAQRRLSPATTVVILVFALLLIAATIRLLRLPIQLFVISALLALAVSRPVSWLERHRVPRVVAVIGILVLVIAVIAVLGAIFVPRVVREAAALINKVPAYWDDLRGRLEEITRRYPEIQRRIGELDISKEATKRAENWLATGWAFAVDVAGAVVLAVMLIITTVFMLLNPRPLAEGIIGMVPEPWTSRAREIGGMLLDRLRAWLRGLIVLGAVIGVMVGVGLWILHIPYPVLFGVLAGLLEMIPSVGPVLAAIPPILVALALEPIKALYVGLLFFVVQELENVLLVPFIMRRQLQLHPVSTIFGLLAFGKLFGLFGAIVAVPTVACIKVLYDEVYYPWAHPPAKGAPAAVPPPGPESSEEPPPPPVES